MRKSLIGLFGVALVAILCFTDARTHRSRMLTGADQTGSRFEREQGASARSREETKLTASDESRDARSDVFVQANAEELTALKMKDASSYFRIAQAMEKGGMSTDHFSGSVEERKSRAQERTGKRVLAYLTRMKGPT